MRKITAGIATAILLGAIGTTAFADPPGPGVTPGPVIRFDNGYLDEHPEVARQLGADPRLVDNPVFLANHPGLDSYFANHPEVRAELQAHPDHFMTDEWKLNHDQGFGGAHPVASADHYLDEHPEVAQQLNRHPGLIDDPKYIADHPGLHEFLASHPLARNEWQSNPRGFIRRADRLNFRR